MKKVLLAVVVLMLALSTVSFAYTNTALTTPKGAFGLYFELTPWLVAQQQGVASAKPLVFEVTKYGFNYGVMNGMDVGLYRISDVTKFSATAADRMTNDFGYGLTFGYALPKMMGIDTAVNLDYSMARNRTLQPKGVKPVDSMIWTTNGLYLGMTASKEMLMKGLVVAGTLGVQNSWNKNISDTDYGAFINEIGTSAFKISMGVDYTIPGSAATIYTTLGHIDNTNLVGKEDSTSSKMRDVKQDYLMFGVRYTI